MVWSDCLNESFFSVISHKHSEVIKNIHCLPGLAEKFIVVIKNNAECDIKKYACVHGIHLIDEKFGLGFGENNNIVFNYCLNELGMQDEDFFIVLNPDVDVDASMVDNLIKKMSTIDSSLSVINLYKDKTFYEFDPSVRRFPREMDFIRSFLKLETNMIIDKSKSVNPKDVDWAAGSFMAFKAQHYKLLGGFDENYFMYCEDIDICLRSLNQGAGGSPHNSIIPAA